MLCVLRNERAMNMSFKIIWVFSARPYYIRYRTIPTTHNPNIFLPLDVLETQRSELAESLLIGPTDEPTVEADADQVVCTVCLMNVATRMAIPCAHYIVCRECLPGFVGQILYHRVTGLGGQIESTPFRVPITCPACRAIVGQVIPTY